MASNRRKQDEKHLKILRNLVSLPGNKQCFDCNQKGPTYVNVTIGSFVCTKCSGLLRGLTPPHRVKSISMTTFTSEEIESLQLKGNEYCRQVWLASYDSENVHNTKDEHIVRDLMVAKYEKKLYYMEPSSASLKNGSSSLNSQTATRLNVDQSNKSQYPLSNSSPPASSPINIKSAQVQGSHGHSFGSNLPGIHMPDPFRIIPVPSKQKNHDQSDQQSKQETSFANFDNNPVFSSSSKVTNCFPSLKPTVTPEDKYAALKDLDCLMKMQQESPQDNGVPSTVPFRVSAPPSDQNQKDLLTTSGTWSNLEKSTSSNPFQSDIGNNNNSNAANPFWSTFAQHVDNNNGVPVGRTMAPPNPWAPDNPWSANGAPLPSVQAVPFPSVAPWSGKGNISIIPRNSNNPFL